MPITLVTFTGLRLFYGEEYAQEAIKKNVSACLCSEPGFERNKSDLGPIYWPIYEPLSTGRASWAIRTPDVARESLADVSPHRLRCTEAVEREGAAEERTAQ